MRRIKFRAWDEESKTMYCENNAIVTFSGCSDEVYVRNKNTVDELIDYKLMQCTGLKDKDGVEIYEGDIVEAWSEGIKAIGEIKQRIDGYWLIYPAYQNSKSWTLNPNDNGDTSVKVIGNVYANPELLK